MTFRPQLKTPNNHLDMPELTEFMNYQETDLTNLNCRPKLVLKIKNCLSEHYQAYSDVDEFSPARKIPESSKFVTQTIPPQITPSLSKEACRGKGIGSKDIEIMKPRRKKAAPKTNGNKIKPPVIKKAKTVKKVTTLQKVKPHLKKAEEFFIVSESSDSDIDPPTPKKVCNYVKSSGKTVKAQILHKPETKTSDREKRIRRKSMYADLFGKDSDDNVTSSNNEDSQNIRNRVIEKMNDKVNIHINGDMVDTINDIEEITNEFDNSDSSVIDEEINIRESNNTEADDSDVISLLADE